MIRYITYQTTDYFILDIKKAKLIRLDRTKYSCKDCYDTEPWMDNVHYFDSMKELLKFLDQNRYIAKWPHRVKANLLAILR